ncbi:MAG: DUF4384 domain-containing protein [Alistipes sp.]
MLNRTLILFVLLIYPLVSSAQKVQTITGEYTYYAPSTVSPEQAQQTAIHRAQIAALADAFGTYVYQNNTTTAKLTDGQSMLDFESEGGSEVKGEWLDNVKEPEVTIGGYEQNMLIVHAQVWGRARALTTASVGFTAQILRNGTEPRFQSDEFRDGDEFYLYFKTPVSGYLAVYLVDNLDTAYCLLPYQRDPTGKVRVENMRDYLFFSEELANKESHPFIDEYVLTCDRSIEYNVIYIIFSPNEFSKVGDSTSTDPTLPRQLPFAQFRSWLSKSRIHDPKMAVEQKRIVIRK